MKEKNYLKNIYLIKARYLSKAVNVFNVAPSQKSTQESRAMSPVAWENSCIEFGALTSFMTTATIWGKGSFNFVAIARDRVNFMSRLTVSGCWKIKA